MRIFGLEFNFGSRSSSWPKVRQKHLEKNPYCAACGKKLKLDVHHIEPVHLNPDRELDESNLITLCSNTCHFVFGHFMDYKSWNANVEQDCENYLMKYRKRPYKN